jgi:hypothetical protein
MVVSDQVMVIVSDVDDAKHGMITVVESVGKAGRLVESLLEEGFERDRIRVFAGGEMAMQVRHRPVVTFGADGEVSDPDLNAGLDALGISSGSDAESPAEQVAAAPYQQNGLRFAHAFRPA